MEKLTFKKDYSFLHIDKTVLFLAILLFPHLQPGCLEIYPSIEKAYDFFRILSSCIVIFLAFDRLHFIPLSKAFIIYCFFQGWILIVTMLRNADIRTALVNACAAIVMGLLIEIFINDFKRLSAAFLINISILLSINFISLILYPDGMYYSEERDFYQNWFLGHKNGHFAFVLPCIFLILLLHNANPKNKKYKFLFWISLLTPFLNRSATSIICILAFFICLTPIFRKIFSVWFVFYGYIIAFFAIVIFRLQEHFSFLIENVFHKKLTFTGRTEIWDATLKLITEKPVLGHGQVDYLTRNIEFGSILNKTAPKQYTFAHNQILESLYIGGIVLLVLFIVFNVIIIRKLYRYKKYRCAQIFVASLCAIYLSFLMEFQIRPVYWSVYFFAANIDKLFFYNPELFKTTIERNKMKSL